MIDSCFFWVVSCCVGKGVLVACCWVVCGRFSISFFICFAVFLRIPFILVRSVMLAVFSLSIEV